MPHQAAASEAASVAPAIEKLTKSAEPSFEIKEILI